MLLLKTFCCCMSQASTDRAIPPPDSAPPTTLEICAVVIDEGPELSHAYYCVTLTSLSHSFLICKVGQYRHLPCRVVLRMKRGSVCKRLAQCLTLRRGSSSSLVVDEMMEVLMESRARSEAHYSHTQMTFVFICLFFVLFLIVGFFLFLFKKSLLIWLHLVLVVACGFFDPHWGIQDLGPPWKPLNDLFLPTVQQLHTSVTFQVKRDFLYKALRWRMSHCVAGHLSNWNSNIVSCELSSTSWNLPKAGILKWVAISPPGDLPSPGIEPRIPHCRWILYCLSNQGATYTTKTYI